MLLPGNFKEDFEQKGYAVAKSVFTPAEIDELRRLVLLSEQELSCVEEVLTSPGKTAPATRHSSKEDLLSNPYLRHLVSDDRLLTIVKTLLGSDDIIYTSEGSWTVHRNTYTTPMEFHKDNSDRLNGRGPDWTKPFYLIRIGIYLQDHSRHSGGVSVFEGSHSPDSVKNGKVVTEWGKRIYVKTEPGDVVVWYLKTTHAGDWGIPRPGLGFLNLLPVRVLRKLHRFDFLFQPQPETRAAVFLSYGTRSSSTDRYLQYLRTRKWSYERGRNSQFDPSLAATLQSEKKLEVINITEVMKGVNPEDVGGHREIPF
jgi:hypothetical protein